METNNNTTALTPATENKPALMAPKTVKELVKHEGFIAQIASTLPKHVTKERFSALMVLATVKTPKLLDCTLPSVAAAFRTCAQLGLEPDGRRAHLIPYGNTCQFIIDYKGIVELVMRNGNVSRIHSDVVCENDVFEYDMGEVKAHKIDFKKARGAMVAVYCVITTNDGATKCEVMTKDEVEAIRKRSKAAGSGPWVSDFNEMAKKTVFKRASKWLVWSPEIRDAIEKDDDAIEIEPKNVTPAINLEAIEGAIEAEEGAE